MKKIVSAICAFALAMALPMAAFAAEGASSEQGGDTPAGPTTPTTPSGDVVVANGDALVAGDVSNVTGAATSAKASNVPAGATVLASYEINGKVNSGKAAVTLYIGKNIEDGYVTVFIQHANWNEQKVVHVKDSSWVTVEVSEFSIFTVVEGAYYGTSPQTGIDSTGVATACVACAAVAAGAVVALRKKVTE